MVEGASLEGAVGSRVLEVRVLGRGWVHVGVQARAQLGLVPVAALAPVARVPEVKVVRVIRTQEVV